MFPKGKESEYRPLNLSDDILNSESRSSTQIDEAYLEKQINGDKYPPGESRWNLTRVLALCLLLSATFNVFLMYAMICLHARMYTCPSKYTGLAYDTEKVYHTNDELTWNDTHANKYWDDLDTSPLIVALHHSESDSLGLERSYPFPWDNERGLYFIKAFHHLHCLKVIRHTLLHPEFYVPHHLHCIESLKTDIMCRPDDTLMPSEARHEAIGDGQVVQCKNFDALILWAKAPERESCYKALASYGPKKHVLEKYAFCPKDSMHYETMTKYFEEHGHKPLFLKDDEEWVKEHGGNV